MRFEQLKVGMYVNCSCGYHAGKHVVLGINKQHELNSFYTRRLPDKTHFSTSDMFEEKLDADKREKSRELYRYFGCGMLPFLSVC